MKRFGKNTRSISWLFSPLAFLGAWIGITSIPLNAMPTNSDTLPTEREIHNTFSENKESGGIIGATNPMELINRLRNATALDNATPPSDAIDEALNALENQDI